MRAVAVAERRDDAHAGAFGDVPATIDALYVTPRYFLYRRHGHSVAVR